MQLVDDARSERAASDDVDWEHSESVGLEDSAEREDVVLALMTARETLIFNGAEEEQSKSQ